MRVIDAHAHTWTRDIISKEDIHARQIAAERAGIEAQLDSPLQRLTTAMDAGGVERAVILPIDSGISQTMPLSLQEKTDWHTNEIADSPNIVSFVGIDPRRGENGLRELERAVTLKGCRGLKLYPPNGFYPDDDAFYPYYEKCVDLGIPIVIHTGFTSRFKHVKYAQPVYVDKVAADFPTLKIVLAHVGVPWVHEALMVASKNPNVSVDVSGWQFFASKVPIRVYQMIAEAKLNRVFPSRMLFGSDFPLFEYAMPLKKWVDFFTKLRIPEEMIDQGYPQVTNDEIQIVMYENAKRLFFGDKT
ncbi:MAG: amidohydrolase family protein [Candidatus Thorarchaeota archaeon]|nr:amidohydrolase family protein [Candidatus Thorarchaeota archaeon]